MAAPDSNGKVDPSTIDPGQYTVTDYLKQKAAYEAAVDDGSSKFDVAKANRNDIVYGIMTQIEIVYAAKYQRLFGGKNVEAITGDGILLGLSSASTIATNVATKTILSALGTAFSGLSLSIDKNYYAQQSFQIIGIAMQTRRDKIRAVIVNNLNQDVAAYPLNAAKRDLITYLQAGTLASGLQELQEEAGAQTAKPAAQSTTVPSAPAGLTVSAGVTQALLVWSAVPGATSYTVYHSPTADISKASPTLPSVAVPTTIQTGLTPGSTSYYAVSASNAAGESPLSNVVVAQLLTSTSTAPSGGILAPAHGQGIMIGTSAILGWDASAGAQSYIVNRIIMNGSTVVSTTAIAPAVTTNTYTDQGAGAGGTPSYSVIAVDANGNRSPASTPFTPTNIQSVLGTTGVIFTPH